MKVTFAFLMPIKNDLILRAARGETTERTPIWVMRQAGRVLPEYRAVRKSAGSFLNLLKNPEAAAEVTIQPVDILGVDAAILFSDILVIPEAMGLPYTMDEGRGPWFENVISNESDLEKLSVQHIEDNLDYVFQTIRLIKQNLNDRVPLIGFAGAPWTIFCYMVEGKGSKTFSLKGYAGAKSKVGTCLANCDHRCNNHLPEKTSKRRLQHAPVV
jgi:uroporphyrinogen decarboxylase